MMAKGRACVFG